MPRSHRRPPARHGDLLVWFILNEMFADDPAPAVASEDADQSAPPSKKTPPDGDS